MADDVEFELGAALDVDALAVAYGRQGWLSITPFLTEAAAMALEAHLIQRRDWVRVMNAGSKVFEMPRAAHAALDEAQRAELSARVAQAALTGFQYAYESIRVADQAAERTGSLLDRFAGFMTSRPVIELLRAITRSDIDFADAQATLYQPGDFLTRHDDDVAGKHRHAAYVLGLTPRWRTEWGGLLLLHQDDLDIRHGFSPGFNTLRLFSVPTVHSVSAVWPHAPHPRLSITGWLRRN